MSPPLAFWNGNIEVSWVSRQVKVAWIFRDDKGNTILHSRHAFSNVGTRREDELIAIQWAVRDIINTRQQRIILDSSCALAKDTFLNKTEFGEYLPLTNDINLLLRNLWSSLSFLYCLWWADLVVTTDWEWSPCLDWRDCKLYNACSLLSLGVYWHPSQLLFLLGFFFQLSFRYWGLIPLGCYGLYSCEHPWFFSEVN